MEKRKGIEIVRFLEKEAEKTERTVERQEGLDHDVLQLYRKLGNAHSAAGVALAGAFKMLSICESGGDFEQVSNDMDCADLKWKIAHALCALSEITPQDMQRVEIAMYNTELLFDAADAHLYPDELTQ